jgi:hypothetical protein
MINLSHPGCCCGISVCGVTRAARKRRLRPEKDTSTHKAALYTLHILHTLLLLARVEHSKLE